MLIAVIAEKNYLNAQQKIQAALLSVDTIELRLDYFEQLDIAQIQQLRKTFAIPIIFTLRKSSQGGLFSQAEDQRLELLEKLAQLEPEFIDLEYDVPVEFVVKLKTQHPKIQLICSYHDFTQTPDNLAQLLDSVRHEAFSIYKIVTFAQSTLDCLRMLAFVKDRAGEGTRLTGFCMGELGAPSRILGPIVGNALHYACVDDGAEVAPGQLSLSTLINIYNFRALNSAAHIYALLGDPVAKSIGHVVHNQAFRQLNKNAVYVKLNLKSSELNDFFKLAKHLPFKGFSVTMPLKQAVMLYCDSIANDAKAMDSVNTLINRNGKYLGCNTDAKGAVDAIENKIAVANKKVVVIGAGGAARAIGYEAIQRGAQVIFLNRTAQKAHDLAEAMHCLGYGFDELPKIKNYDILINTTPIGMAGQSDDLPVPEDFLIPHSVVMDTVYNPIHTPLLNKAKTLNCTLVYGYEMFVNQAILQLQSWFAGFELTDEIKQIYRAPFK
jgi:3-dehydroquinate dehydratase/shikimate dehydrogenase